MKSEKVDIWKKHSKIRQIISNFLQTKNLTPLIKQERSPLLAVGSHSLIYIFSNSLEIIGYLHEPKKSINYLKPLKNRQLATVSGFSIKIKIWNLGERSEYFGHITTLEGHRERVTALCQPTQNILISGSIDSIRVWNIYRERDEEIYKVDKGIILLEREDKFTTSQIIGIVDIGEGKVLSADYSGGAKIFDYMNGYILKVIQWGRGLITLSKDYQGNIISASDHGLSIYKNTSTKANLHSYTIIKEYSFENFMYYVEILSDLYFMRTGNLNSYRGFLEIRYLETGKYMKIMRLSKEPIIRAINVTRGNILGVLTNQSLTLIDRRSFNCYLHYKSPNSFYTIAKFL